MKLNSNILNFSNSANFIIPTILIIVMVLTRYLGNFLVFHAFSEFFSVFVALTIAFVTYSTYTLTKNKYLLFLGLGYFWIGLLDILHIQTYPGMNIYDIDGMNPTLTLWILTRFLEAILFILAPIMRNRDFSALRVMLIFGVYSFFVVLLAMSSFPLILFDNESGLTFSKIAFEYGIVFILLGALKLNSMKKNEFQISIYKAVKMAIVFTIISEALFTLYTDAYGFTILLGHIFKFLSFWVLLVTLIKTSLTEPLKLMAKEASSYNAIPVPAILVSNDGIIRQANEASLKYLGLESSQILGQSNHELFHPSDLTVLECPICQAIQNKETIQKVELTDTIKDSTTQYSLSFIDAESQQGNIQVCVDVTQRKKAKDELKEQHEYLQSIIDGIHDPIMLIREDYTVEVMNSSLSASLQHIKLADPAHPKCYEVSHHRTTPCDGIDHPCPLRDVMDTKEHITVIHNHYDMEGAMSYVELSVTPLLDKEQNCVGIIESSRDITAHLAVQEELREQKITLNYQAHHDVLTGLSNRILFNDRLEQGIKKSQRNKRKLALFFIDLDHFKEINDSLGHTVGDKVLKAVTQRLSKVLRKEDSLARLGGDEFTVILEGLTQIQDASLLAEKILKSLREPITIENNVLYVSCSIGISFYPEDGVNAHDLLKHADVAMYKAKEDGRNNFKFYSSEMTELVFERVVMEASLREALKKEEFVVYYQPQVNGETGTLIGMEGLVRWQHPNMGLVLPEKFIPILEKIGLIMQLDQWVMKKAMRQIVQWYSQGFNPGVLSLNLSIKQLEQKDFIDILKMMLEETGCKPEWIELEVTEGQIMNNPDRAIIILNELSAMGIELAVDDFGTGYSSLSYLKRLPIHKLKIDQSFIKDLPDDEEDATITKSVIALAQSLNLKVIAEGVENEAQKNFLVENGCKNIQGYFYGKPMPAAVMEGIFPKGFTS